MKLHSAAFQAVVLFLLGLWLAYSIVKFKLLFGHRLLKVSGLIILPSCPLLCLLCESNCIFFFLFFLFFFFFFGRPFSVESSGYLWIDSERVCRFMIFWAVTWLIVALKFLFCNRMFGLRYSYQNTLSNRCVYIIDELCRTSNGHTLESSSANRFALSVYAFFRPRCLPGFLRETVKKRGHCLPTFLDIPGRFLVFLVLRPSLVRCYVKFYRSNLLLRIVEYKRIYKAFQRNFPSWEL